MPSTARLGFASMATYIYGAMAQDPDPPFPPQVSPAERRAEARELERLRFWHMIYVFLFGIVLGAWIALAFVWLLI